ncbi:MAG: hypothetical protein EOP04_13080 [Proteobacteria bacterium]|nr:MAG: hypothetical protein EOP04_13080 [Pseudomonadota bacterium]
MLKTILTLSILAATGVANAAMEQVTDKTEVADIKTAVFGALSTSSLLKCYNMSGKEIGGFEVSSAASMVPYATAIHRDDSGQPILAFTLQPSYGEKENFLYVTTDAAGLKITRLQVIRSSMTADKRVNTGTLAKPSYVTIPGVLEKTTDESCTVVSK